MDFRTPFVASLTLAGEAYPDAIFPAFVPSKRIEIQNVTVSAQQPSSADLEFILMADGVDIPDSEFTLPGDEPNAVQAFASALAVATGVMITARVTSQEMGDTPGDTLTIALSGEYIFSNTLPPVSDTVDVCRAFGFIRTPDGMPDAGATVLARQQSLDVPRSLARLSRTYADVNGEWYLDLPQETVWEFTVRRDGVFDRPLEIPNTEVYDTHGLLTAY